MRKMDEFFAEKRPSLTFDDVRLQTGRSAFDFHNANIESRFSRNIPLKIPIVSAAMDKVTEQTMAIALASLGAIGIIHRRLPIEEQAKQVRRVKLSLNGRIDKPISIAAGATIEQVLNMCEEKRYAFRSFPVLDNEGRLVGILTSNDIDFCDDKSSLIKDHMTDVVIHGDENTSLDDAYQVMKTKKVKVLPLINSEQVVAGMFLWSDVKRIKDGTSFHNTDKKGQLFVGAAIGTGKAGVERAHELANKGVDVLVIDTAQGDSYLVEETFELVKRDHPEIDIVVGNISQFESAERLVKMGADGIKVGQGGGSICSTRVVTGVGAPQVTAIYNCANAAWDKNIPICGDGGIANLGDIPIALAAGADSVMLGNMLAGTDESPGEVINHKGRLVKFYRGMGSPSAMEESADSRDRYNEQNTDKDKILAEGVEGNVPYSGKLENVVHRISEALRRSMGYVGVQNIDELHVLANFDQITHAGFRESNPHDIEQVGS